MLVRKTRVVSKEEHLRNYDMDENFSSSFLCRTIKLFTPSWHTDVTVSSSSLVVHNLKMVWKVFQSHMSLLSIMLNTISPTWAHFLYVSCLLYIKHCADERRKSRWYDMVVKAVYSFHVCSQVKSIIRCNTNSYHFVFEINVGD